MFRIAWKNIWRNRRRTLITTTSVVIAVFFAVVARSLNLGVYQQMIDGITEAYSGYAQIQTPLFKDERDLMGTFVMTDSLRGLPPRIPGLDGIASRFEYGAMVSNGNITRFAAVIGVDPGPEAELTDLPGRIQEGDYLRSGDAGALIGESLAEDLGVGIGDTIIMLGAGYMEQSARGLFPVRGITKDAASSINRDLIYLSLDQAQEFFVAPGRLTSIALICENEDAAHEAVAAMKPELPAGLSVYTWDELSPEIAQFIEVDSAGDMIFLFLLYIIIAFGIFGTILMMTAERRHEFGILLAIGMRRSRLGMMLWLETFMLGALGVCMGMLSALPVVLYFKANPIPLGGEAAEAMAEYGVDPVLRFAADPDLFFAHSAFILSITALIGLYPVIKIARLKESEAMRA